MNIELKGTRLASILNSEIDGITDSDTSKGDVMARMARSAGVSSSTVGQILSGDINCPPISRLEGFAEVLGVSLSRLTGAAASDGCEYDTDGKAFNCRLTVKTNTILSELKKISNSLKNM